MKIFEEFKLGNIRLKNRLIMAPMTTWSGEENGHVSEAELDYYRIRSSGCAMVITATTYTLAHGKGFSGQFYAGSDDMLASLKKLSKAIQLNGAKAILQVFHAGRKGNPLDMPDGQTRSASNIPGNRLMDNIPQAMTLEEIHSLIQSFYEVTIRAYQAGFDGIEIHGANTYLLQQFFSPHANRRDDEWGGSLKGRASLPLAIVESCLKARETIKNQDFLIGYRFSPEENHNPGIQLKDTDYLLEHLCRTDLDYLHVSLSDYRQDSIRGEAICILNHLVETINGRKPFIGVGRVFKKEDAEDMLNQGVDLVAVGRQLVMDPKTIEKWKIGEEAFDVYQADNKSLGVPGPLNDVIIKNKGWFPI